MQNKEDIRDNEVCDVDIAFQEWISNLVCSELQEKIDDGPIIEEYSRMTKYLRAKYGDDFKKT